jgi:hypothetical protein
MDDQKFFEQRKSQHRFQFISRYCKALHYGIGYLRYPKQMLALLSKNEHKSPIYFVTCA